MRTDIVIVDDHSLILEGLKSLLSSSFEGSSVYIAQNASQLLSLMKQYQFSVFIVDIALPDMDGFDLIHIIKSQSPEARIMPMICGMRRRSNTMGANRMITSTRKKIHVGSVMGKWIFTSIQSSISFIKGSLYSFLRQNYEKSFSFTDYYPRMFYFCSQLKRRTKGMKPNLINH